MPGTRSSRTRAYLARVFAVLALVAGVAMMQGTPCESEFAWTAGIGAVLFTAALLRFRKTLIEAQS